MSSCEGSLASAEVPERPSQQLFASVAVWLGEEADTVRLTFFALLSLLIEFSALGLIRLSSEHHGPAQQPAAPSVDLRSTPNANDHSETVDDELKHKKACLLRDIVLGKQTPVLRQIKKAGYGLTPEEIKALLVLLQTQGVLEPDQRNSYQLAQTEQPTPPHPYWGVGGYKRLNTSAITPKASTVVSRLITRDRVW